MFLISGSRRRSNRRVRERRLTRFADDFVGNFQYRRDAERFQQDLTDRFGKFGLELAEEKTRVMRFGKFFRSDLAKPPLSHDSGPRIELAQSCFLTIQWHPMRRDTGSWLASGESVLAQRNAITKETLTVI